MRSSRFPARGPSGQTKPRYLLCQQPGLVAGAATLTATRFYAFINDGLVCSPIALRQVVNRSLDITALLSVARIACTIMALGVYTPAFFNCSYQLLKFYGFCYSED